MSEININEARKALSNEIIKRQRLQEENQALKRELERRNTMLSFGTGLTMEEEIETEKRSDIKMINCEWIKTDERMPKPFSLVLVYRKTTKRVLMAEHNGKYWLCGGTIPNEEITHWQTLPKAPCEKGEGNG